MNYSNVFTIIFSNISSFTIPIRISDTCKTLNFIKKIFSISVFKPSMWTYLIKLNCSKEADISNRIRPNPIRIKATRASPRTGIRETAKQKHTNSFICILSIITSYPIIISFFISSNFIKNKIRTKSKIKFSNKIITISLVTYKITFILNIIYCNIGMINTFFKKINAIIICVTIYNNYILSLF